MKIAIVGNAGSGKSTLALRLHKLLQVPLYHLDQYFWKPGWQEPDRDEFQKIHNSLCNQSSWIIDGMAIRLFDYRIERADIVIFLDIPTYRCFYRVCTRAYNHFGREYFSSAKGCPERGPDWKFFKFVMSFNRLRKPIIVRLLEQHKDSKKIFVVKNHKQLQEFIARFERNEI